MNDKDAGINSFISMSFRDVADLDYIAARTCYRYGLDLQFLWFSLQALEKYLKAILLYNRQDTKQISHNIIIAVEKVKEIQDIEFDVPRDVEDFIEHVDKNGKFRYFEAPYSSNPDDLLKLDKSVWYIRRYCRYLRGTHKTNDDHIIDMLKLNLQEIQSEKTIQNPHKFKIFDGKLEKILSDKQSPQREQLVHHNFYYGKYKKYKINKFHSKAIGGNPPHFLLPGVFEELEKFVRFPKDIKKMFHNIQ